eukprot:GHVQ01033485.1.p1 GENE.GHVQ01033485.1~~GHVQ01033485.1.p1  ORF type:complete len:165 (+),score=0.01 GHVQ01033485.1:38-496(+)
MTTSASGNEQSENCVNQAMLQGCTSTLYLHLIFCGHSIVLDSRCELWQFDAQHKVCEPRYSSLELTVNSFVYFQKGPFLAGQQYFSPRLPYNSGLRNVLLCMKQGTYRAGNICILSSKDTLSRHPVGMVFIVNVSVPSIHLENAEKRRRVKK